MTEGLIRKVITKWIEWEGLDKNVDLLDVEKDLIKEVKKLNKHQTRHKGQNFTAVSLYALIGNERDAGEGREE